MSARGRRGATFGDVVVVVAVLALAAAMAYPLVREKRFEAHTRRVGDVVASVRAAAVRYREAEGDWPPAAGPGEVPDALEGRLPTGVSFEAPQERYTLQWLRFEMLEVPPEPESEEPEVLPEEDLAADSVPAPPPPPPVVRAVGALAVHTRDTTLLAALHDRFGAAGAFVRDSVLTLLLGPPSEGEELQRALPVPSPEETRGLTRRFLRNFRARE